MNEMSAKREVAEFGKATVYVMSGFGFGYKKIEVREGSWSRGKYAQYSNALHVNFKRPRERSMRGFTDSSFDGLKTIILEGWGHPDPDSMFGEERDAGEVMVSESRYSACDPGWSNDFNTMMNRYLESKGSAVRVIVDVRGQSAY